MQKQADWSNYKNVLCIRLDNLGDIIMTTPAIRALKEAVPGRKITLLASRAGNAITEFIPEVDEVLLFDTPWEKNANQGSSEGVFQIVEELKKRSFDAAVIFTVYSQNPLPTAMLCYLAGIRRVAGYCRENPYQLLPDWIPEIEPLYQIKHEVDRQLHLVQMLGANIPSNEFSLQIPETAFETLNLKLKKLNIPQENSFIVIHPGVSESKRQYPVELFAQAAKELVEKFNVTVLLTGVNSEKSLTQFIEQETGKRAYSLAGELSLVELVALLKNASLLISNNTGPVHIAAAVKTPVIVLYALTNPQHTPWKVPHKVLPFDVPVASRSKNVIIQYAYEKAFANPPVEMIKPQEIIRAAEELLQLSVNSDQ